MVDKLIQPVRPIMPRIVTTLLSVFILAMFYLSSERSYVYFDLILLFIIVGIIDGRRWLLVNNQTAGVVDITFLVLFIYEVISPWLSQYSPNSFIYLEKIASFILLYFLLRMYVTEEKTLSRLLFLMVIIAFIFSISNIQYFISYYLGKKDLADFSNYKALYQPLGINSNELASLFLCLLPFPTYFVFKGRNKYAKSFCLLTVAFCMFGVLVTFSRGAYIALVVWMVLMPALLYFFRVLTTRQAITCLLALILVGGVVSLPVYKSVLTTLAFDKTTSQQLSTEGRKELFNAGFKIVKKYPLNGVGSNNFPLEYAVYKKRTENIKFNGNVTNSYLQLLIEKGILGLLLYTALFVVIFTNSYRKLKAPASDASKLMLVVFLCTLLALLVRELFYASVLINDPLLLLVFIICFVCIKCSNKNAHFISAKNSEGKVYLSVFVLSLLITVPLGRKIIAELSYTAGLNFYNRGEYAKALKHFEKCIAYDGNNAIYQAYSGLAIANKPENAVSGAGVLDSSYVFNQAYRGKIDAAIKYYEKAISLNEDDLFVHNAGWLYFIKEHYTKAQAYFKHAVAIDPNVALYHISLGMSYEKSGLYNNAINEYALAVRLSPDILDSDFFKALGSRAPGMAGKALSNARQGLETYLQNGRDVKLSARLAKIYLNGNEINKAHDLFLKVVAELPNLNRPQLYLGDIYRQAGDTAKMLAWYKLGGRINPNDFLSDLKLGNYYKAINDTVKANNYYKSGYQKWSTIFPEYSTKTSIVYRLKRSIHNAVLPADMLQYITTFQKE